MAMLEFVFWAVVIGILVACYKPAVREYRAWRAGRKLSKELQEFYKYQKDFRKWDDEISGKDKD